METIHTRIKQRREALGLSMKELAALVGVSAWQTVQQWERENGTAPKRDRLQAVANALQTTPEYLTYGSGLMAEVARAGDDMLKSLGELLTGIELQVVDERERRRKSLSAEAVLIGAAFDKLTTQRQRDAILSQLEAFEVWEWGPLKK